MPLHYKGLNVREGMLGTDGMDSSTGRIESEKLWSLMLLLLHVAISCLSWMVV